MNMANEKFSQALRRKKRLNFIRNSDDHLICEVIDALPRGHWIRVNVSS